jgi:hypothetical protein
MRRSTATRTCLATLLTLTACDGVIDDGASSASGTGGPIPIRIPIPAPAGQMPGAGATDPNAPAVDGSAGAVAGGSGGGGGASAGTQAAGVGGVSGGTGAAGAGGAGAGASAGTDAAGAGGTTAGMDAAGAGGTSAGTSAGTDATGGTGGASAGTDATGGTTATGGTGGAGASDPYDQDRNDCVDRINGFRASIGLGPLVRWTDAEACTDMQSQDDQMSGGAHANFGDCGESAQNTCPGWGSIDAVIQDCLQGMWDEGPPPTSPCTGQCFQDHGHYINMSSTRYTKVACGFYEYTSAMGKPRVWHNHNFR